MKQTPRTVSRTAFALSFFFGIMVVLGLADALGLKPEPTRLAFVVGLSDIVALSVRMFVGPLIIR